MITSATEASNAEAVFNQSFSTA